MKKVRALSLAVVMGVSALPASSAFAEDDIVIGYAAAMTGLYAPYDSVDGAKCEIDRINDAGGVLGRKLRLEARDMKSDAIASAAAGQELIDMGVTAILGPPSDDTLIPIAALAAPLEIAVISPASTQVQFPAASPTNAYLMPYGDNLSAGAAAEYAIKLGFKTAVLMISRDIGSYGLVTPEYFGDAFEHLGGKVLKKINYNTGLSDYSAQLAEVQAMDPKPDVIFGGFIIPEGGVMPRQFKAAGLGNITFMGTDGYDDPGIPTVAGDAASMIKFITHGFPTPGSALEEFYNDCTKKRGYTVQNIFFGLAGEAVLTIKTAIEMAGSAEPAKVNAAIKEIVNMKGITADSITYKDRGGVPIKVMAIVEVKDGKFTFVDKILPQYVPKP